MNYKSQLAKNTVIIAIGKLSTQILSYILLPLYTAKMAVDEYGTYDFVCTISLFLCPFITMLMEECMFRFLLDADTEDKKKSVVTQTILYTVIGTLVFIPLCLIVLNIVTDYSAGLKAMFIIFVISNIMITLSNSLARGFSRIKLYSLSNFILGIFTLILQIIVLIVTPNAFGMLMANSIANIGTALFIFFKLRLGKYIGKRDGKLMKEMLRYSMPLVPNNVSWTIINMSDRLLLTAMMGSYANGIYAMANKFPNIVTVLYSYFNTAWKESASKIIKDENKNKFYSQIYHDTKKMLYAVTLLLIAVMPFAFPIFVNEQYNEAFIYIPIVAVATYYSNLSSFYGGIFVAFKNTKIMGVTTFIAAAINLVIDLVLIQFIGIYAACISTLVADVLIYYYRRYKIRDYIKLKELKMLIPSIVLAITIGTYYLKYIPNFSMMAYYIISAIILIFTIFYSIVINKVMLGKIVTTVKNKIRKKA